MKLLLIGLFAGVLISWFAWGEWWFSWSAKHKVRSDLFHLSFDEVMDEFCYVTRFRRPACRSSRMAQIDEETSASARDIVAGRSQA